MNTLNLIRLNLNSPYEVWNESHDSYFFETDYGVKYKISFGDDAPIWKTGAYTFDIQNTNQKASPSDEKVKKTIINIVEEFFNCNADILLYICETGDNKQAMRNRLFVRWFNEYSFQQNYVLRTAMVKDGDQENFAAIIVQRNHPDLENILATFDETISYFKDKP
jgi:hypothetical protein